MQGKRDRSSHHQYPDKCITCNKKKSQLSMADYKPCMKIETWSDSTSVFCAVSDNGEEIRSQDLPHLFEPFFTTKNGEKEQASDSQSQGRLSKDVIQVRSGSISPPRKKSVKANVLFSPSRSKTETAKFPGIYMETAITLGERRSSESDRVHLHQLFIQHLIALSRMTLHAEKT